MIRFESDYKFKDSNQSKQNKSQPLCQIMAANTTVWMCFSPTCLLFEVEKELLIEDEGHAADLFYFGLGSGVPVDEVGCDGDCQLPPELLSLETWERKRQWDKEWNKETAGSKPALSTCLLNQRKSSIES